MPNPEDKECQSQYIQSGVTQRGSELVEIDLAENQDEEQRRDRDFDNAKILLFITSGRSCRAVVQLGPIRNQKQLISGEIACIQNRTQMHGKSRMPVENIYFKVLFVSEIGKILFPQYTENPPG